MRRPRSLLPAFLLFLVPACDAKDDSGGDEQTKSMEEAVGTKLENAVDKEVEKETGVRHFTKGMSKKACEMLPPSMVAETFDVPEGELKQMKVMGCIYSWKSEEEALKVNLMLVKAHKTLEGAKQWFENSTASKSEEEVKAEMEVVKEKLKEREEVKGKIKEKAADSLMGAAADMAGGRSFQDVEGIGDEARINEYDGSMWVRVGNLTFSVSAYKGKRMPKPELKSMNTKAIIAASKKANDAWLKETWEQRKADVTKVAKKIVAEL